MRFELVNVQIALHAQVEDGFDLLELDHTELGNRRIAFLY